MNDPVELSDTEFMQWAGVDPQRWALLPREKRESWLDYLIERVKAAPQSEERAAWWRLAYVIARATECSRPSTGATSTYGRASPTA